MTEQSNAWLSLENNLALSWWQYYQWLLNDRQGPEPELSAWDKKAVTKLSDIEHTFRVFKKASGGGKEWRLLSVWSITQQQIQAGYNQHGDAHSGGNFECAGLWYWRNGDAQCRRDDIFGWHPIQVERFMPDSCGGQLCDATTIMGQPPRDFG